MVDDVSFGKPVADGIPLPRKTTRTRRSWCICLSQHLCSVLFVIASGIGGTGAFHGVRRYAAGTRWVVRCRRIKGRMWTRRGREYWMRIGVDVLLSTALALPVPQPADHNSPRHLHRRGHLRQHWVYLHQRHQPSLQCTICVADITESRE